MGPLILPVRHSPAPAEAQSQDSGVGGEWTGILISQRERRIQGRGRPNN